MNKSSTFASAVLLSATVFLGGCDTGNGQCQDQSGNCSAPSSGSTVVPASGAGGRSSGISGESDGFGSVHGDGAAGESAGG